MTKFRASEKRQRVFLHAARNLPVSINDFTLDFKEINPEKFKNQLNEITERFTSEKAPENIESFLFSAEDGLSSGNENNSL